MTEVSQICHTRLEGQKLSAQDCYGHKLHALKGQKLSAQDCYGHKLHALKGQKLSAQGNALGIMAIGKTPCFTLIEQALSVFFNVNYI